MDLRIPHSPDCTAENRSEGWYPPDCARCTAAASIQIGEFIMSQRPPYRGPGWDAKVRQRVRIYYGSITAMAEEFDVPVADLPMKTWSNLVTYFGGTDRIEAHLVEQSRLVSVLA